MARTVEPPFIVHRDRSPGGAEIVTSVPIEEFFKLQRAARGVMWKALSGDQAATATIEGIFAQAHAEGASDNRGSAVISTYLLNEAFQEIQEAQKQAQAQAEYAHAAQQRAQAASAAAQAQAQEQAPPAGAVGAAPEATSEVDGPVPNHPMYVGKARRAGAAPSAEEQRAAYEAAAAEWKSQQKNGARA